MNLLLSLISIGLPLSVAIVCFYYAFRFLKAARILSDLPISKIRSAAQGFVALNGYGVPLPDTVTQGKLNRTPCLWYYYQVEEYCQETPNNSTSAGRWKIIEQETSNAPFLLRDETGECVIFPRGADVLAASKTCFQGDTPKPPLTPLKKWQQFFNRGNYRYTEYQLKLRQSLSVTGMFYSYDPKSPLMSDENFELSSFLNDPVTPLVNVIIQKDLLPGQKYLLSALSTKKIIIRYYLQSFLFFVIFLIFTLITTCNTFPLVKKTLNTVHTQQLIRQIMRAVS